MKKLGFEKFENQKLHSSKVNSLKGGTRTNTTYDRPSGGTSTDTVDEIDGEFGGCNTYVEYKDDWQLSYVTNANGDFGWIW
jgi:hypothetical protein